MNYPNMTMLFSDYARFKETCLATTETVNNGVAISGWPAGPLNAVTSESGTALKVRLAKGSIKSIGVNMPHPELDQFIQLTRRKNEELAPLLAHQFHLMCWYDEYRGDGFDATLDLFRLARIFAPFGVLGVIHDNARQCLDVSQIGEVLSAAKKGAPQNVLQLLLVNICPLWGDGFAYYVSRGARELGSRNVCVFDDRKRPMQMINEVVHNLINYIRQGAVIRPGENIRLGGDGSGGAIGLTAMPLGEYRDYIMADAEDDVLLVRIHP